MKPPTIDPAGAPPPEPTATLRLLGWVPAPLRAHRKWPAFEFWITKLGHFFLAQGLLQVLTAVSGFYLLRWMTRDEYAIYTLTYSIQAAMFAFSDVGFSNAIIPLVGQRINDPGVVGRYIAAARSLRRILLPIVVVAGVIALTISGSKQHLELGKGSILFALAVIAVWFNATSGLYTNPILIRQDIGYLHTVQNSMAVVRFGGLALGYLAAVIGSVYTFVVNTLLAIGQAFFMRRRGLSYLAEPARDSPEVVAARREMLVFIRPQVPILLFQALQGQIMVFIVSFFGNQSAVADIGAATRLNQLYAFAPFLCGWILQPYFARIPTAETGRRFFQILSAGFIALATLPGLALVWPDPFLLLLGKNYQNTTLEIQLVLICGTIGTTTAFMVTMCFARGWLRDTAVIWVAGVTLTMQIVGVLTTDVSTAAGTLYLVLCVSMASFVTYLVLALLGMRHEYRSGGRK